MMDPAPVTLTFNYLNTIGITLEAMAVYPLSLRCQIQSVRPRHEFLKKLQKAQYNPDLPNYISLRKLLHPDDKYFAEEVCRVVVDSYERFLKTL